MKFCPRCNHAVQDQQTKCPNCGVVFAQWYPAHPSLPPQVSPQVSAPGKYSPRYQKYIGLSIILLCFVPFIFNVKIHNLYILWINWFISGIGLSLYSKGSGRSYAWGLLALLPLIGHLIGLIAFASNKVSVAEKNTARGLVKVEDYTVNVVNQKKQFYITLASSVLLTIFLAEPHVGFIIYIIALPLLIWLIYSTYVVLTKPDRRKWQLIRMAVWIISVLVISGIHYNRRVSTRHFADSLVAAINKYQSEHGSYPDSVETIGVSQQQLKEQLGFSGYSYEKGKPDLFYADTFIVFHTNHYDFQKNSWIHHGD